VFYTKADLQYMHTTYLQQVAQRRRTYRVAPKK